MIAFAKPVQSKQAGSACHPRFLEMLPKIRRFAQLAFRAEDPAEKEELVAEVTANAFVAFARLVERGKEDAAHPTPLAMFAVRQVRSGRRVGGRLNCRDVSSRHVQVAKGLVVERIDQFDGQDNEWRETLIEDKKAGPAETAAARIDVADWFKSLGRQKRKIAKSLARGEATSTVAHMYGLSAGRISQLRDELRRSWHQFQREPVAA
jgi:hypothetical protein